MEDVKRSWDKSSTDKGVVNTLFVKACEALIDFKFNVKKLISIIYERQKSSIPSLW